MPGRADPPEAAETPRARLRGLLQQGAATVRELSQQAGLAEREVLHHLEHLGQSARGRGERLVVQPASCIGCGFVFEDRQRVAKPGRCPACRGTRIALPRFSLEASAR